MGAAFGFAFFGGEELLNLGLARPLGLVNTLELLPFYVLVPAALGLGLGAVGFQGIAAAIWLWGGFCALVLTGPLGGLLQGLGLPGPLGVVAASVLMLPVVILLLFLTKERDSLRWGALAAAWGATLVGFELNQWLGSPLSPLALGVDVVLLAAAGWVAPQLARLLAQRQPRAGVMAFLVGLLFWSLRLLGAGFVQDRLPAPPAYKGAAPPDLLLVVVSGLRADRLGHFGYADGQTPVIDQLAARSLAYEQAQAASSDPLSAFASLLTGRLPGAHKAGRVDGVDRELSASARTVAEYLRQASYNTGAIFAEPERMNGLGLDQGFAWLDSPPPIGHRPLLLPTLNVLRLPVLRERDHASAAQVVARAQRWYESQASSSAPTFLMVQLADLEPPYKVPRELDPLLTDLSATYDQQLTEVDTALGALLEAAGKDTWVVLTADVGLNLGEHGRDPSTPGAWRERHGGDLYQEQLGVPLLVFRPRNLRPHTIPRPVSTMDVLPTVLDLVELRALEGLDGRVLPEPFGRVAPEEEQPIASQLLDPAALAVRVGPWKLVERGGERSLYNLVLDPGESQDLAAQEPAQVAALSAQLPGRPRPPPAVGPQQGAPPEVPTELPPGDPALAPPGAPAEGAP